MVSGTSIGRDLRRLFRPQRIGYNMKALRLVAMAIGITLASTTKVHAQGTVFLNNYDSRAGFYLGNLSTPASAGTPVEIFGGPSVASLSPLTNSLGQGPIFIIPPEGLLALGPNSGSYFNVGYGSVPGVPSLGTGWFIIRAWTGPDWDTASYRGEAWWSQTVGTAGNPAPLEIPGQVIIGIPEPSAAALAALALAIFGFRHANRRLR